MSNKQEINELLEELKESKLYFVNKLYSDIVDFGDLEADSLSIEELGCLADTLEILQAYINDWSNIEFSPPAESPEPEVKHVRLTGKSPYIERGLASCTVNHVYYRCSCGDFDPGTFYINPGTTTITNGQPRDLSGRLTISNATHESQSNKKGIIKGFTESVWEEEQK